MENQFAITVAEAIRAVLGGMLFGLGVFTILFIILRSRHDNP